MMELQLRGIIPPITTPFTGNGDIDVAALRKEVSFHLDLGVHGICCTGSTGEGHTLSADETRMVTEAVVAEVDGRVPVVSGIIRDSTRDVIAYGKALRDTGVDALQVTPVHYLFTPDSEGTIGYYETITQEVGLPVVIYNVVPWSPIEPSTLARILNEVDGVIAVKQSGGDIHRLAELLKLNPRGGNVLTAIDDLLYPTLMMGAQGAIAATLTVVPELCMQLWDSVQSGDHNRALQIHETLLPVWRAIDGSNMPARIKFALGLQGRDGGVARQPMAAVTQDQKDAIEAALAEVSGSQE